MNASQAVQLLKELDVGKTFAKYMASVKTYTNQDEPGQLPFFAKDKIYSLIPYLTCRTGDSFLNLNSNTSLLNLSHIITESEPGAFEVMDLYDSLRAYERILCIQKNISVRAVQSESFWGTKITVRHDSYNQLAWLSVLFQINRVVQLAKIARIEDRLLRNLRFQGTVYKQPVYTSDILAILDMVRLPGVRVIDRENSMTNEPEFRIQKNLHHINLSEVKEDLDSSRLEYRSYVYWMFDILRQSLIELSNGTADIVYEDSLVTAKYNPFSARARSSSTTRYATLPKEYTRHTEVTYIAEDSGEKIQDTNQFLGPKIQRVNYDSSTLAEIVHFLHNSWDNEFFPPLKRDKDTGKLLDNNTVLLGGLYGRPVSLGISFGLTPLKSTSQYAVRFQPTIRLELKEVGTNRYSVVLFHMPGKLAEIRSVL